MIEQLLASPYTLPVLFFLVALLYSSVGLGGGSSYTALMALTGVNILAIPTVSLILNLIVTTVGSITFIRNGHARLRIITPFLVTSIPMAYIGGAVTVSPILFYWVLLISLVFAALRIYFFRETRLSLNLDRRAQLLVSLVAGSALGLVAGIVGIGGGIYLIPLIIILGLGDGKQAAACGAIFVWLNSLSGLVARLQFNSIDITEYLWLIGAVMVGAIIGSSLGAHKLSARFLERLLGMIIIIAIVFLARNVYISMGV
jgi:uncharacterized membrane protein YfcA